MVRKTAVAVLATAALVIGLTGPAFGWENRTRDPLHDAPAGVDIGRVSVHSPTHRRALIAVHVRGLHRTGALRLLLANGDNTYVIDLHQWRHGLAAKSCYSVEDEGCDHWAPMRSSTVRWQPGRERVLVGYTAADAGRADGYGAGPTFEGPEGDGSGTFVYAARMASGHAKDFLGGRDSFSRYGVGAGPQH